MKPLILASASPRRRQLLEQIGVNCIVRPVDIPEVAAEGESARAFVERLAIEKAAAGYALSSPGSVVLGSDTVVVNKQQILGKPENRDHALQMLKQLSGGTHQVMTAVAVTNGELNSSVVVTTDVSFHPLTEEQCQRYWESGEPVDKAGSYGIQGLGAVFVASIKGSYSGVVGLPLSETAKLLARFGIPVWQTSTG